MSDDFLQNYVAKAMGSSTFTSTDQEDFAKRQKVSHPGEHRIPQFMLNHPMGQSRQSTFKNAWKYFGIFAKKYEQGTNPWEWNFNQLAEKNKTRKRKHNEA